MSARPTQPGYPPDALSRRVFLASAAAAAMTGHAAARGTNRSIDALPIIDTHIHLFDPARPQGVPYRADRKSPTYLQGASPAAYRRLAAPLGIVGAIKVEASPWVEDNLWALETSGHDEIMLGVIGNLKPEDPHFPEYLDRYRKNRLFRGIRYGNLWGYDLAAQAGSGPFIEGLRRLSDAGLILETANPRINLLDAVLRVNDAVPDLTIVLDHLPAFEASAADQASYTKLLDEFRARPTIICKLSAVIHEANGVILSSLAQNTDRLDLLCETFGPERVMFGSDWPNSDRLTRLPAIVALMRNYYAGKPVALAEQYFYGNSARVYRWTARNRYQAALSVRVGPG